MKVFLKGGPACSSTILLINGMAMSIPGNCIFNYCAQ